MDSKSLRSEMAANLELAATVQQSVKPSWKDPIPVRVITKRVTRGFISAMIASLLKKD